MLLSFVIFVILKSLFECDILIFGHIEWRLHATDVGGQEQKCEGNIISSEARCNGWCECTGDLTHLLLTSFRIMPPLGITCSPSCLTSCLLVHLHSDDVPSSCTYIRTRNIYVVYRISDVYVPPLTVPGIISHHTDITLLISLDVSCRVVSYRVCLVTEWHVLAWLHRCAAASLPSWLQPDRIDPTSSPRCLDTAQTQTSQTWVRTMWYTDTVTEE